MPESKKNSQRVELLGNFILLSFSVLATLFLAFNLVYVYFWPSTHTISTSTYFLFTGDDYFKIVDSSAPVDIEIIGVNNFSINVKKNNQTETYQATTSENIFKVKTVAITSAEYRSQCDTKAIISSTSPFIFETSVNKSSIILYGLMGLVIFTYISVIMFFERKKILKRKS